MDTSQVLGLALLAWVGWYFVRGYGGSRECRSACSYAPDKGIGPAPAARSGPVTTSHLEEGESRGKAVRGPWATEEARPGESSQDEGRSGPADPLRDGLVVQPTDQACRNQQAQRGSTLRGSDPTCIPSLDAIFALFAPQASPGSGAGGTGPDPEELGPPEASHGA